MNKKIYIYNKEKLEIIGEPFITNFEEFQKEPTKFFPNWNNEEMIASETNFSYPKLIDGKLEEKSQKELKLDGIISLSDGEYIEDGKIVVVERAENLLKTIWNTEKHVWEESASTEDFENKIIMLCEELEKLKKELQILSEQNINSETKFKRMLELEKEKKSFVEKLKNLEV